jgi:hypothetical protein
VIKSQLTPERKQKFKNILNIMPLTFSNQPLSPFLPPFALLKVIQPVPTLAFKNQSKHHASLFRKCYWGRTFVTTQWTQILEARGESPAAKRALTIRHAFSSLDLTGNSLKEKMVPRLGLEPRTN